MTILRNKPDDLGSQHTRQGIRAAPGDTVAIRPDTHLTVLGFSSNATGNIDLTLAGVSAVALSGAVGFRKLIITDAFVIADQTFTLDTTNIRDINGDTVSAIVFNDSEQWLLLEEVGSKWRIQRAATGVVDPEPPTVAVPPVVDTTETITTGSSPTAADPERAITYVETGNTKGVEVITLALPSSPASKIGKRKSFKITNRASTSDAILIDTTNILAQEGGTVIPGGGYLFLGDTSYYLAAEIEVELVNEAYWALRPRSPAEGQANTVTGAGAVAFGSGNTAEGSYSAIGGGSQNSVSGSWSFIPGGLGATDRGLSSVWMWSSGYFIGQGDSQIGYYAPVTITHDDTPTIMNLALTGPGVTQQIVLPEDSSYGFSGRIQAFDGTDCKYWEFKGLIKRIGGSITLVDSTKTVVAETAGASAWDFDIAADGGNLALTIAVLGEAAKTINWNSEIKTLELCRYP